jgi:hypothetical protein
MGKGEKISAWKNNSGNFFLKFSTWNIRRQKKLAQRRGVEENCKYSVPPDR